MKLSRYLMDHMNLILAFIIYCLLMILFMGAMKISSNVRIIFLFLSVAFGVTLFFLEYWRKNQYFKYVNNILDELDEKYLLFEILEKPKEQEKLAYYKILQKTNRSMLENVMLAREARKEYKEYIESWVHEIKIPITSAKLICENNRTEITNKMEEELEEINNYVEQALFYARMDQVANDFMIHSLELSNVIKNVLARNKKNMIQNRMKVELTNLDLKVYSDEKWLEFILNQILINSIKYKKEKDSILWIEAFEQKDETKLKIRDNGIGIKKSEIGRVFDKGFTGTNGRNQKRSTGIGLYICKRLSEELGMKLEVASVENEYTEITITLPRKK